MKLSENFSLEELTTTNTGLANVPGAAELEKMKALVEHVLQPLRNLFGESITVTSGYRSPVVNRRVGGAATSQHVKGEAADIVCRDKATAFNIIRAHLQFDQLIWEEGNNFQPDWIHVSFKRSGNRGQVLKYKYGIYSAM
ncbi:MAG: D-Ala-D-Ala carboxypeptidase family metallohydrolase [Mangrovibacterium sp.]